MPRTVAALAVPLAVDERPIGMFDSGFGGLTVARALIDLLPAEHLVYVGDTGRYPYGPRPLDEVRASPTRSRSGSSSEHDVKLVIVACNTAAAAGARRSCQAAFAVPVVGVIEPGVRSLARATRSGRVGVIGTVGTIGSGAYQQAVAGSTPDLDLTCAACPGFVEFVERGETPQRPGGGAGRAPARTAARRQGRRPAPRLHPLPVPGPHHQRRHGPRRRARVLGRRDRLRGAAPARRAPTSPGRPSWATGHRTWLSSGDVDWFRELGRAAPRPRARCRRAHHLA